MQSHTNFTLPFNKSVRGATTVEKFLQKLNQPSPKNVSTLFFMVGVGYCKTGFCFDIHQVHMPLSHHLAEVHHFCPGKLTLCQIDSEMRLRQAVKKTTYVPDMRFPRVTEDNYIV